MYAVYYNIRADPKVKGVVKISGKNLDFRAVAEGFVSERFVRGLRRGIRAGLPTGGRGAVQQLIRRNAQCGAEGGEEQDVGEVYPRFPHLKILVMYECLRLLA